ncbi:MAG: DUF2330 domain-containing protein, partial [Candidatus Bathyarchaeota archaeon]
VKEVLLNINTRAYDFWSIALEEWTAIAFSMMNKELRVVFQFLEHSIIFCSNHWYYKRRKPRIERGFLVQKFRPTWIFAFLFLVSMSISSVFADRGMIPVNPEVSVYEPGQKAILAWNGHEEIMILSTDVSSSQQTIVLEILPLPSKPTIAAGSFQSFQRIQNLIWNEGLNLFIYGDKSEVRSGSVEVVFHEEIGAHNITVVKASDTAELSSWMDDFLEASDVDELVSLGSFESVIEDYMNRGFRYYVLDLITVSSEEKSVDPILYRFDCGFLYYPLVITTPVGGNTEITLFLLTEDRVDEDYSPFERANYRVSLWSWQPIEFVLSKGDLSTIDLRIGEIFQYKAWLTVLKYNGKVSSLNKDLMISGYTPTEPIKVEVLLSPMLIVLSILLGAASALAGVATTLLITRSKPRKQS